MGPKVLRTRGDRQHADTCKQPLEFRDWLGCQLPILFCGMLAPVAITLCIN